MDQKRAILTQKKAQNPVVHQVKAKEAMGIIAQIKIQTCIRELTKLLLIKQRAINWTKEILIIIPKITILRYRVSIEKFKKLQPKSQATKLCYKTGNSFPAKVI